MTNRFESIANGWKRRTRMRRKTIRLFLRRQKRNKVQRDDWEQLRRSFDLDLSEFKHPLHSARPTADVRSDAWVRTQTSESSSAKILRLFPGKVTSLILDKVIVGDASLAILDKPCFSYPFFHRFNVRCLKLILTRVYIYIYISFSNTFLLLPVLILLTR